MTRYDDADPNLAICRWEVAIDHDNNSVHIFYWHSPNGNWVWLEANAGGRNPGVEYTDVTDAFTYDTGDDPHAILLFVGNTPDPSENWKKADVTDISYR